jgi:hypothetical protein
VAIEKQSPFLAYTDIAYKDPSKDRPKWVVGIWKLTPDGCRRWATAEATRCPFCGAKLPDPVPRKEKPEKIHRTLDGDYCDTCVGRNENCECFPPQWHWQWPEIPNYVLSKLSDRELLELLQHTEEQQMRELSHYSDALRIAMQALQQVAEFGHVGGPHCCAAAPIYECCCYDKSQWDISREALERIEKQGEEEAAREEADREEKAAGGSGG